MNKTLKFLTAVLKTAILPVAIYLVFKLIRPESFGSLDALYIISQQAMVTSIISLGLCCNMTIGIWDFSPGSIVTLVGLMCGHVAIATGSFPLMVLTAVLLGVLIGLINATVYTVLRVPSVVVTVGLLLIYESFSATFRNGIGVSIPKQMAVLGTSPYIFIVTGIMLAIMYIIFNKTKLGFSVRALGNNEIIAKSAGINPRKIKFITFTIAGIFFGIAGLISLSYGTALSPAKNMGTMSVTFDALMAVFIAIYLSGICNRVIGVIIGNFCMKLVSAGLVAIGVDGTWQKVIIGIFLLFFIGFTQIQAQVTAWVARAKERRAKKHTTT
ncbi:MAG: ABC transporter permease [Oscillospiraceae bacterium]